MEATEAEKKGLVKYIEFTYKNRRHNFPMEVKIASTELANARLQMNRDLLTTITTSPGITVIWRMTSS